MRRLPSLLGALLLLGSLTACPMSPKRACGQTIEEGCRKQKRCNRTNFERLFTSVSDCVEETERALRVINIRCEEVDESFYCSDSERYSAWNAGACVRQEGAQDCGDGSTPEVCDNICKSG